MNEETTLPMEPQCTDTAGSDPLPPPVAATPGAEPDGGAGVGETECHAADAESVPENRAEDSGVSPDSLPDSHPDSAAPTAEDGLEQLRAELKRLRAEIAERTAFAERMNAECEEFRQLYPDTHLAAVPDKVWEDVRRGIPLAAAYALAERRRSDTESRARQSNRDNEKRSAGGVSGTVPDYFSPDEVRAMSQSEVRANYQNIMRSMKKWR